MPASDLLPPGLGLPLFMADITCFGSKYQKNRGAWAAQSVERLTLGFSSGHDCTVPGIDTRIELCAAGVEPAWDSLFPSLSAPPPFMLSQNK